MKLRPSLRPLAGVPGSPQNLAAEAEMWNIADVTRQGPTNPNPNVKRFHASINTTGYHMALFLPVHVNGDALLHYLIFTVQTFVSF